MTNTRKIVALLNARPGKEDELRSLLLGMAPDCRGEPGCLRWDVWQDPGAPSAFVLDELYTDTAAITAHRETAHFKAYLSRIGDLAERRALVLDPVDVSEP